jgi:hypothetical protein
MFNFMAKFSWMFEIMANLADFYEDTKLRILKDNIVLIFFYSKNLSSPDIIVYKLKYLNALQREKFALKL